MLPDELPELGEVTYASECPEIDARSTDLCHEEHSQRSHCPFETVSTSRTILETLVKATENQDSDKQEEQDGDDSEYIRLLHTDGILTPGDSGVSLNSKPPWLDMEKLRAGQRFAENYFFGMVFSQLLSLGLLFATPDSMEPLIFSRNSDTPFKAFKRYLSTAVRVRSWYQSDLWDEGQSAHRNFSSVRALHNKYRKELHASMRDGTCRARCKLDGPLWDEGVHELLRRDADAVLQKNPSVNESLITRSFGRVKENTERVNQSEMSVTQFGFVGLVALYPNRFGAGSATEEELEGFVHLWRVIGYLLGIEDRFNFCNRGLAGVRERSRRLVKEGFVPMMAKVGAEWEHMMRCVVKGTTYYVGKLSFEVVLMYLCDTIGLHASHCYAKTTLKQRFWFYMTKFLMCCVLRVRYFRNVLNKAVHMSINKATEASPERLQKLENRTYPYQIKQNTVSQL